MRRKTNTGFTLIELVVAMAIGGVIMLAVGTAVTSTLRARTMVESSTESTEAGARITNLLVRDLNALWHYNIKNNRVLVGRDDDVGGFPADKIDFLCSTDSVGTVPDTRERQRHASICEVGYWVKDKPNVPGLLQLWRREDPMVDDKLLEGGTFQLVHDRLKKFNVTYYKTKGRESEEFREWDSSEEDQLPMVVKIEFEIERLVVSRNRMSRSEIEDQEELVKKYTHYFVFDRQFDGILQAGTALIPVIPPGPPSQPQEEGGGGGGPPAGAQQGLAQGNAQGQTSELGNLQRQGNRNARNQLTQQRTGPRDGGRAAPPPGGAGGIPRGFFPNGQGSQQPGSISLNDLFRQFGNAGR